LNSQLNSQDQSFIPAQESTWFISLFDLYVRNLFWRRFKNIAIDQHYQPSEGTGTIYFLNHTSWWDGLIPLLLNQKLFRQNARALMEDKQMRRHRFFSKIGAFSVNLDDPRGSVRSLRYAAESMKRRNASLFIYPEGKIVPFSDSRPAFKEGLAWIARNSPQADLVPIGIYITTAQSARPELFIRVGRATDRNELPEGESLTGHLEQVMQENLQSLTRLAHSDPEQFQTL
jgi:chlorobactene lauroyltransferase